MSLVVAEVWHVGEEGGEGSLFVTKAIDLLEENINKHKFISNHWYTFHSIKLLNDFHHNFFLRQTIDIEGQK